jgi:hypothetical protein
MPRGGKTRTSGQGRPKGSRNRLTVEAKEAFRLAAEGAGGVDALTAFAIASPDKFWPLYARLIPVEHAGKIDVSNIRQLTDEQLDAQAKALGIE